MSAVRSPASIDRNEPETDADLAPGPTSSPSSTQPLDLHGGVELGEHLGRARGAGEHAFARGRRRRRRARASSGTSDDVMSPSGPRSSASARGDRRRGRRRRAGRSRGSCARCPDVGREPDEARARVARGHEPAEDSLGDVSGKSSAGVRAARLLACAVRRAHERSATASRLRTSYVRSAASTSSATVARPLEALGASRRTPAPTVIDPLQLLARSARRPASAVRARRRAGGVRGRSRAARRWPRARPCPASIASTTRGANTRPSSSEFDASRLAPWTPVHAASPHAHRPGSVDAPSRSVHDAAAQVVRGRRDRQPLAGRGRGRRSGRPRQIVGNRVGEVARCRWRRARGGRARARRAGGVIARATTSRARGRPSGCSSAMNALALVVAQDRALAAQRLREQRARHRRVVQRGRVELHELDVGDRDPGAQRHGDAVAGGHRRVGGDREAAGRRRRWRATCARPRTSTGSAPSASSASTPTQRPPSTSRSTAKPTLVHLDHVERSRTAADQGPLDLGAGRVAAGVDDPRPASGRPRGASASTRRRRAVEVRAERHELADAVGALGRRARAPRRGRRARRRRRACRRGAARASRRLDQRGRHAALGVAGGRRGQLALGQHAPTQAGARPRTAAERPATPLPRTRTSVRVSSAGRRGRRLLASRRAIGAGTGSGGCARRRGRRSARSPRARRPRSRVGDDDDPVAGLHEPGGGAVERSRRRDRPDRVGLEPGAVVDVEHVRPARTRGGRRAP